MPWRRALGKKVTIINVLTDIPRACRQRRALLLKRGGLVSPHGPGGRNDHRLDGWRAERTSSRHATRSAGQRHPPLVAVRARGEHGQPFTSRDETAPDSSRPGGWDSRPDIPLPGTIRCPLWTLARSPPRADAGSRVSPSLRGFTSLASSHETARAMRAAHDDRMSVGWWCRSPSPGGLAQCRRRDGTGPARDRPGERKLADDKPSEEPVAFDPVFV